MTEPRSTIHLVEGGPLDMTYQHTIDFKTPEEQRFFWGSLTRYTLDNYSYTRRERRFIQVDKNFDDIEGINYLFYRSSERSKWYYCFVTDREYISDRVSRIYFEIDVLQTYLFDMKLNPSFISQAHVDRWDAEHKPIYSITDEGLNYGPEYVTESAFRIAARAPEGELAPKDGTFKHGFYLVFCTEHNSLIASGAASEPTRVENTPTPYTIYLIISDEYLGGSVFNIIAADRTGQRVSMPGTRIEDLQAFMANSSFGEFVKQIVYLPYFPFPYYFSGSSEGVTGGAFSIESDALTAEAATLSDPANARTITLCKITEINDPTGYWTFSGGDPFHHIAKMPFSNGLDNALPSEEMFAALKANPRTTEYDRRYQSKLLCFPYRYNIFTDWTSAPIIIKNEFIGGDEISVAGSIAFSFNLPRRYWVENYRGDPEGRESGIAQPLPLEQPVLSDAYYAYMLQNKNQISANITNSIVSGVAGAATSGFSGAISGAAAGMVGGPVGAVAGAAVGAISGGLGSAVNAGVNVSNLIRSENARQADLKNLPDTILNSNDCSFAIRDGSKYLTFYRKKIACEFEEQLAQFWHMYGYKVDRLDVPHLKSRVRFNFIKTIGANITGPIESNYLAIIKQIFDAGVTFWHYSEQDFHPLDYTYENPEVSLL